jgi:hypothetical protein
MSCYNREREVIAGRNGKGAFPKVVAATLHPCRATLAGDALLEKFKMESQPSPSAMPRLTQYGTGLYLLDAIVTDALELSRLVARRLPGAQILESTIGPSFSECRQS